MVTLEMSNNFQSDIGFATPFPGPIDDDTNEDN